MTTVLGVLLGLTMLAILGVLAAGIIGVAAGQNPRRSNALMRARVALQGTALVLFVLLLLSRA
jgi:hypothetical protein